MTETEYLILGNGIAGLSAAKAVREADAGARIHMVTRERRTTYLRPLLTKADFYRTDPSALTAADAAWHQENRIGLTLGCQVLGMDCGRHLVRTTEGDFSYRKCIYALGGDAFVPPIEGREKTGVFAVRTPEDVRAIRRRALTAGSAVVIGGGVIGMEMAELLYRYGLSVTVLETLPYLLPRVLDAGTAREYVSRLEEACSRGPGRLVLRAGIRVEAIEGAGAVEAVRISGPAQDSPTSLPDRSCERIPCELVVCACGIRPCVSVAREAGLAVDRAVVVDARMRTSDPDVYACGDCASYQGRSDALWKPAMEQGRIAGLAAWEDEGGAGGAPVRYRPAEYPILCSSELVSLFAMGDLAIHEQEGDQVEVTRRSAGNPYGVMPREGTGYRRLVRRDGRLVGAALVGDLSEMEKWKTQLQGGNESED